MDAGQGGPGGRAGGGETLAPAPSGSERERAGVQVTFEEFEKAWSLVLSRSFQPGFSVSEADEVCLLDSTMSLTQLNYSQH